MKKNVPDPPAVLCISPGLTHEEAVRHASDYITKAFAAVEKLPVQAEQPDQENLKETVLYLKIGKAFLTVALAASTITVPV